MSLFEGRSLQHLWKLGLAALVLAGGVLAALHFAPAGGPYTGTWKVTVLQPGVESTVCLLKVGGDEAKPTATVIDAPAFETTAVEDVRVEDGALRFRLRTDRGTYRFVAYGPKDGTTSDRLLGSVRERGFYDLLRMERTNLRELDPKKATIQSPGYAALSKALEAPGLKDKEGAIREVLKKSEGQPAAQHGLLMLVQLQARSGASVDELKASADRYLAGASPYGREMELQTAAQLGRVFGSFPAERAGTLAIEYGKKAEKLLHPDDPPTLAAGIFKSLAKALRAAGKDGEAKELDGRAAELNGKLDEEFAKNNVKFQPAPPAGRRFGGDRVVLAELFTGAQCPPCVAADIAFDAALQVYQPSQVVFLQYHEHIPRADPLTCPAGEARLRYYDREVQGTPAFLLDGKPVEEAIGGPAERGEQSYAALRAALDQEMDAPSGAHLQLTAQRQGDAIDLTAEVSDLRQPGEKTRLRFVLIEDVVRYAAPNGQRLHHHVVRDFPGGVAGFALPEKAAKQTATVNLGQVRKQQLEYLSGQSFPEDDRPLELQHLKAVAFIQNDATKQVLQAAQADVTEAK